MAYKQKFQSSFCHEAKIRTHLPLKFTFTNGTVIIRGKSCTKMSFIHRYVTDFKMNKNTNCINHRDEERKSKISSFNLTTVILTNGEILL